MHILIIAFGILILGIVVGLVAWFYWKWNESIQNMLENEISHNKSFGGGVVRISTKEQGVLWEGSSGFLTEDETSPMELNTKFEIASITKVFVAVEIMHLSEEHKINLDDFITNYLSSDVIGDQLLVLNGHNYTSQITIYHLLSHYSGLPNFWDDPPFVQHNKDCNGCNEFLTTFYQNINKNVKHFWDPREILKKYVPQLTPIGIPGSKFHYSDTNYIILGLLIEKVEGSKLHEVLRKQFFEPLHMNDTYLAHFENQFETPSESHRYEDTLDLYSTVEETADWASGGLRSTTKDLETFMYALVDGEIITPQSLEKMQEWHVDGSGGDYYGLGLIKNNIGNTKEYMWGHDGYGNVFMFYYPKYQAVFTGTFNQTNHPSASWNFLSTIIQRRKIKDFSLGM